MIVIRFWVFILLHLDTTYEKDNTQQMLLMPVLLNNIILLENPFF